MGRSALEKAGVGVSDGGSECVICLTDAHHVLLKPCGHLCLCRVCYDRMQKVCDDRRQFPKCPLCRTEVAGVCKYPLVEKIWERRRPLEPRPQRQLEPCPPPST